MQRKRRSERRKRSRAELMELGLWLNDRTPRDEYAGASAHDIFLSVGIHNPLQLKELLDSPDVQIYLQMVKIPCGQVEKVVLRGKEFLVHRTVTGFRITDDMEILKRVSEGIDTYIKEFKTPLDVKQWIDHLPKWSEAPAPAVKILSPGDSIGQINLVHPSKKWITLPPQTNPPA